MNPTGRNWIDEFGGLWDVPATLEVAVLAKGFEDTSWHNDVCPSFRKKVLHGEWIVYSDNPNPHDRECGAEKRFALVFEPADAEQKVVFESDSVSDLLIAIEKEIA